MVENQLISNKLEMTELKKIILIMIKINFLIKCFRARSDLLIIFKNIVRSILTPFKNNIISILSLIPTSIRTSNHVLEKYDAKAGAYINQIEMAYKEPFIIKSNFKGNIQNIKSNIFFTEVLGYVEKYVFDRLEKTDSIIEIGAGELTTLARVIATLDEVPKKVGALDISWSRLKVGRDYAESIGVTINKLLVGDLFSIPLRNQIYDIVYTHYALEQSPHRNEAALSELLRIAKKFLILIEPAYELGDFSERVNILKRDYIRGLPKTIEKMGLNLICYERVSVGPYDNCAAVYVIQKEKHEENIICQKNDYICPRSKEILIEVDGFLYAQKAGLVYPILDGIPCLLPSHSILASKYRCS
jgi:uncharacterized protein YbaR (Trm112 family)